MTKRWVWTAVATGAGIAIVFVLSFSGTAEAPTEYQTIRLERGMVAQTVSSAGRLGATLNVQVSSQVSGLIKELAVDYNSIVTAGQVIARIDEKSFEAKVVQARAGLGVAKAKVVTADAAVTRAEAELDQARSGLTAAEADVRKARIAIEDAKLDLDRKQQLLKGGNVPANQVDRAKAVYDTAMAELSASEARVSVQRSLTASRRAALDMARADSIHARAVVEQEDATLRASEIDLDNTFIRSPVDGVVIDRAVELGQTVAANFQAPRLFLVAQDLRNMQVEARVDEADIGQIQAGMMARFTVDSFPGQDFEGKVSQVRKQAREVDTVVTYMVVIDTDNPDLRLMPGMTANVQFVIGQRHNVLRVPNAALRFRPAGAATATTVDSPATQGEEDGEPASAAPRAAEARGPRLPPLAERAQRLAAQLRLSESQTQAAASVLEAADQRARAARRGGGSVQERQAEFQSIRKQTESEISALLDPEQKERYGRMRASQAANPMQPGQLWLVDDKGQPKALSVRVGMSDGSFTEVAGGGLKEGQEIVVGLKYRGGKTTAPSLLSRFRL